MFVASLILQNFVLGTQILLVAVSLYVVLSASKIFHLAVGAIGATVAYAIYFALSIGWPIWSAILLALLIALILGLVSGVLLEPFTLKDATLLGLLASFSLAVILESLIAISFGTGGKSLQDGVLQTVSVAGIQLDIPGVITIIVGFVFAILSWIAVTFTGAGRVLRGLAENTPLVTSFGINNKLVRYGAYVVAAVISGLVITLAGWHTALTPLMGFHLIIGAFIALLVGGVTDLRGTIIASYLIALAPGLIIGLSSGVSENWRLVFVFGIAVLVLSVRPQGLFSTVARKT